MNSLRKKCLVEERINLRFYTLMLDFEKNVVTLSEINPGYKLQPELMGIFSQKLFEQGFPGHNSVLEKH